MNWIKNFSRIPSPERFAQRLIDELKKAGDQRSATFDAADFQLKFAVDGRSVGVAHLRNLYDEMQSLPAKDRDNFFRFAVRSILAAHKALPDEFEDARCDVLLTVRNRSYFSLPELRGELRPQRQLAWPYQPFGEQLGIGLVYDLPEAMVMLQSSHLEAWGVSFYEVYEAAISNLSELDVTFATIDHGSYISNSGDHYDASRMVLSELIDELEVEGAPVVLLPNRDRLIVTGSDDRTGLETSALIAQQLLEHARPMTGQAFIRLDYEWMPWLPDPDHPAYSLMKSMALATRLGDYTDQLRVLQLHHRIDPIQTPAPAEFRVHESGTRQPPFSYCVWQEGQPQLLPKTDRVCLLRRGERTDHPLVESINVDWPQLLTIAGDLINEDPNYYPTRYLASCFPNEDRLSRLA